MSFITTLMQNVRRYALMGLITTLFSAHALADIAVIVNPASGVSSLSINEAKAIFMKKKKSFPNGNSATPVDQDEAMAARVAFTSKVLGKDDDQIKAYWSKRIFSGRGSPPKAVGDDNGVKAFVANTPGAIGYIDSKSIDSSVTVVLTVN